VNNQTAQHRADPVQTIFERGHYAEIVPGAANAPEQILVLNAARGEQFPVGRHDIYRQQIIDGKAVLTAEPALSSAERQAGNAGSRDLTLAATCSSRELFLVSAERPTAAVRERSWISAAL
jgi:hypothetical protein